MSDGNWEKLRVGALGWWLSLPISYDIHTYDILGIASLDPTACNRESNRACEECMILDGLAVASIILFFVGLFY